MSEESGLWHGRNLVLGIDYGTDSCRAVVIDAGNGEEIAHAVAAYPRWAKGMYCDPASNRFRQHPLDYIESLESALSELGSKAKDAIASIKGIAIDTTGSTPCAVTAEGTPLALVDGFVENPNAMFILWKDHTATAEADRINELARTWGGVDYTKYEGGIYSSEWFWAKMLHVFSQDTDVEHAAYSFLEHCDWMPALLTGTRSVGAIKRSRCAMGHKAMWHAEFGGYPSVDFLSRLHPSLSRVRETLGTETWTSDSKAGLLSEEWATRLGLPAGIPVAVGAYDAHMGAVGGGVRSGVLVKVMGTSTCDMIVAPEGNRQGVSSVVTGAAVATTAMPPSQPEHLVKGICGQVDGSIIPSMLGYEAGQSAFGDVYAWFKKLLMWPVESFLPAISTLDNTTRATIHEELDSRIMSKLENEASVIDPENSTVLALDWLNGRRTPDANQKLTGALTGLTLGTTAPMIYRALIEATAYGTRAIVERFRDEGIAIERIVAIGGVARKSALVMQIVADVLDMPIDIVASDQSVALGAAMFAATVAGIYPSIRDAQNAMTPPIEKTVAPNRSRVKLYSTLYAKYSLLGLFIEKDLT
jgi:L-ribulokinase